MLSQSQRQLCSCWQPASQANLRTPENQRPTVPQQRQSRLSADWPPDGSSLRATYHRIPSNAWCTLDRSGWQGTRSTKSHWPHHRHRRTSPHTPPQSTPRPMAAHGRATRSRRASAHTAITSGRDLARAGHKTRRLRRHTAPRCLPSWTRRACTIMSASFPPPTPSPLCHRPPTQTHEALAS